MKLRPYQLEAFNKIFEELEIKNIQKTLLVLPTGTGKTIVFCKVIEEYVKRGMRVLILAHRGELLDQAADKMSKATGLAVAVEKAENTCIGKWERVVVGSVQTLMREKRLAKFDTDYFDVIIVDEAHHVLAQSYQNIFKHFCNAKVLGVTATPDRGDMRELGEFFESLAYEYTLPRAIKEGFLAKIKAQTIPIKLDLSTVKQQAGDFSTRDLGNALDPYLEIIANEMLNICMNRKTVVFLPLVKTSQKFKDILNARGFRAAEVNGSSKDRKQVLKDFDEGKYNVLCNSMLLTEGWDCPSVDTIIVLRPTKVRSLYCQMVGRGTRLFDGKEYLLLLDFLWLTQKHELCRPSNLIREEPDVVKKMTEAIIEDGGAVDITAVEEQAVEDATHEREEALAKQLSAMKHKKRKLVDPLQFEMSIMDLDLVNFVPEFGYQSKPVLKAQKDKLEKMGIFPDDIKSRGKAELLINKIQDRRVNGYATPKQIRFLEKRGFNNVGSWQFSDASNMISRIAANGWRNPRGVNPKEYSKEIIDNGKQSNNKQDSNLFISF